MIYQKISKQDVFSVLVGTSLDFMNPIQGTISLIEIARSLKTSRYQVKKFINELNREGLVKLNHVSIPSDDEIYPPYWGYIVSKAGKETEYYKQQNDKQNELIEECFGLARSAIVSTEQPSAAAAVS